MRSPPVACSYPSDIPPLPMCFEALYGLPQPERPLCGPSTAKDRCSWPGRRVRNHLHYTMRAGWIGRGAPMVWPPRSPDLIPLHFFLWVVWRTSSTWSKTKMFSSRKPAWGMLRLRQPTAFFKTRGQRYNIIWIFFMPPGVPTCKSAKTGSENKKVRVFLYCGANRTSV